VATPSRLLDTTEADLLERIACELTELNSTLNCRFDALDDIAKQLKVLAYGADLAIVEDRLNDIASNLVEISNGLP
jgi:hypothetical protein